MKIIKTILSVAMISTSSVYVYGQTADEIVNKYLETVDPGKKLGKLEAVKMEMTAKSQGMEIPVTMFNAKNGEMLLKLNFQGKEITQMAFDGKDMWSTNFMTMKPEKADAETTENMKQNVDFPDGFLNYKAKGYKVEYLGKETKDGTETFKIKLTKKPIKVEGKPQENFSFYYFDTDSYLPIVTESEIHSGPMKGQKSVSKMSDYHEVDGIYFPFSMQMMGQEIKVNKVTLNPTIDKVMFAFPSP